MTDEVVSPLKKKKMNSGCQFGFNSGLNPGLNPGKCVGNISDIDVNNSVHVTDFPQVNVIRGSFHQGDRRFGYNRNRQCGVNSLFRVS